MAGLTTLTSADTLAATLVVAVREGWMDHRHVRSAALYFAQHSPLMHSGRQKFLREFERRLDHWASHRLSDAVIAELRAGTGTGWRA